MNPEAEEPRPDRVRSDLRGSSIDGVACNVMVGAGEIYIGAFALAVGMGEVATGLVASMPIIAGASLQLATPALLRRIGSYKRWVVPATALQGACFIPLAGAALMGAIPPWLLFVIVSMYWGSGLAAGAAWNGWIGTLVPRRLRARYFANRTRYAQAALLVAFGAAGMILHGNATVSDAAPSRAAGTPQYGFALVFAVAAIGRLVSSRYLAKHSEPRPPGPGRPVALRELGARLRTGRDGRLLGYMLSVQFGVHLTAAYFTPYMFRQLHLSYADFVLLTGTCLLTKFAALPLLGRIAERYGPERVLWFGGVGIVPLSAMWLVSDGFVWLLFIQIACGVAWAAYELATFLLVLESVREDERLSVLSQYNFAAALVLVTASSLGGAFLSSVGENRAGYGFLFAVSLFVRASSVVFLRRVVPAEAPAPAARPVALG